MGRLCILYLHMLNIKTNCTNTNFARPGFGSSLDEMLKIKKVTMRANWWHGVECSSMETEDLGSILSID